MKDKTAYSTMHIEVYDKIIILIDHDNLENNKAFISQMNMELDEHFNEDNICKWIKWNVENEVFGNIEIDLYIKCVPEEEIGSIENIMLDALNTDSIENDLITSSKLFIREMSNKQKRDIQKKSKIYKAIFNTYFAIRVPEEKYDERARILNAFDWQNNNILNIQFDF